MSRITTKQINTLIADKGYELVRGKDYFYLAPLTDDAPYLPTSSIYVCRLSHLSLEEWKKEIDDLIRQAC